MLIGAAPQVEDEFSASSKRGGAGEGGADRMSVERPGSRARLILAIAGLSAAVGLGACHRSHPAAPVAADATAPRSAAAPVAPPPRGKQITIAYSSNLLGEYEPCG